MIKFGYPKFLESIEKFDIAIKYFKKACNLDDKFNNCVNTTQKVKDEINYKINQISFNNRDDINIDFRKINLKNNKKDEVYNNNKCYGTQYSQLIN